MNNAKKQRKKNRMGKRLDIFSRKFNISREYFMQVGTIKEKNGKDLTEAEQIGRGGKNTEKNQRKKDLNDQDNYDDENTQLEPDPGVCKVKWALGSITTNKASGGDRI